MKKNFLFAFVIVMSAVLSACATGPRDRSEMNPILASRDADPRLGLVIVEGEPAAVIEFYDQAGRLFEQWNEAGAEPRFKINGSTEVRGYERALEFGRYKVIVRPYFYTGHLLIKRRLVELQVQTGSVTVDRKVDSYDRDRGRYWGWILRINTGSIAKSSYSAPAINISGSGLPGVILKTIFGR